ncbi:MAG: DUF4491 family protein [Anaerolineales bacterium]
MMTFFGLLMGVISLMLIGSGFVWVIHGERYFGNLWWPYIMGFGVLLIILSFFIQNDWIAALLGAFGASLIWGSTELKNQAIRAELGWYPKNIQKINPPFYRTIAKWKAPRL